MSSSKKRALIVLGVAISVVCLWLAFRGTNFADVGAALAKANAWLVLPVVLSQAAFYWIKAIRWRLLLAPMTRTTTWRVVPSMMIGFMANNVLPAHLGEFVRMFLGARDLGLGKAQVLATIVLERMFDFLSVVFFLAVVLTFGRGVPPGLATTGYVVAVLGAASLAVAAVYIRWTDPFVAFVRRATGFLPAGLRAGLVQQLELGAVGLHAMKSPRLLLGILVTSLLQWALIGVGIYCSLVAVDVAVGYSAAFVVLAAVTFGVTLPAAPGFFGTIQLAFTLSLEPYGVEQSAAIAASVFFHVLTYLAVTLTGLWFLRRSGFGLRQVEAAATTD
ncbi:MAG: lysylphosphatidylglycerol synthase transmembrane domain-containing protein [Planctomycetota bacterium]